MKKLIFVGCIAWAGMASATSPDAARAALLKACPGLVKYSADVELTDPVKQAANLSDEREQGWKEVYSVRARVNGSPRARPVIEYRAMGHTCTFDVEASKAAQISTAKTPCVSICLDRKIETSGANAYLGTDGKFTLAR